MSLSQAPERRPSSLAISLLVLALAACSPTSGDPATESSSSSSGLVQAPLAGTHRVQATGAAAERLLSRGGKPIADYGGYALVDVDGAHLRDLPRDAFVLRDYYRDILLNAGTIDTLDPASARLRTTALPESGKQLHLLQFTGPVRPDWYASLQGTGVRIVAYIPHNAYLVWGDAVQLARLISYGKAAPEVQWDGSYLDDYKLNPRVFAAVRPDGWQVQLVEDAEANADTLARAAAMERGKGVEQRALGYVNLVVHADRDVVLGLARQPDVVSIIPFLLPTKLDERANVIAGGQLSGNGPAAPGWLAFLTAHGLTQAQFDASGFGVDVSDSGLDNGTVTPNHYALYRTGDPAGTSRVAYARLEGTPNAGSTIQGCDGHGTLNSHIIGAYTALGGGVHSDAAGYKYNQGIAPFVKVGSSVIFDPGSYTSPNFESLQSRAYRDGMRVSSNSWGAATGGAYNSNSQRYDALVRDAQPAGSAVPVAGNQEMIIVFAAGNSGSGANTVGAPGTAKNVITAGAAENVHPFGAADQCGITDAQADSANDIIYFSSRGPTDDGRIKPDLVAAGTHVSGGLAQSVLGNGTGPGTVLSCFDASGVCAGPGASNFWPVGQQWTTASSGTSHSTPLIAGAAALVRQHIINTTGSPPSAAMVKALLMNGARYMTGTGANDNLYSNNQGMGHLDLGMTLDSTARLMRDQVGADLFTATGQTRTFNILISDPVKPFRVTLAWSDAPGSTVGNNFNNNLDLTVTVGASTYLGNVFTGRNSVTGGAPDIRNNVESVSLPAGLTGPATITVTATNINSNGVPGNASALDQDFALVVYNTCNAQPGAPAGATASVPGPNQVRIDWTPPAVGNVTEYRIYRGTTSGGPYTQVGTVPVGTTTFTDSTVSGGTTYFYVVRALDCAESVSSNEASAMATGDCTLFPTFAGATSATDNGTSTCGVTAAWAAATPACGGTISYNVYRSRTSGFTPGTGTRIASGASGTSYVDAANLQEGVTYFYVVRAVETGAAAVEEANTVQRSATPTGGVTQVISYFDDLDANRPPSAASYWLPSASTVNTTTGCRFQSATNAWRFGQASAACAGSYPVSREDRLILGGNGGSGIDGFTLPANGPGGATTATLSFFHAWQFEANYDGAFLEYSTTGSAGPWTVVPGTLMAGSPYIVSGTYNGYATGGRPVWTTSAAYPANGAFTQTVVNVDALAGRTVWFAWHYVSDTTITFEGHYLDDVRFDVSTLGSCTQGATPPGPAASYTVTLPASISAGTATPATIWAFDSTEQVATGYTGTANLSSSDAQATVPPTAVFAAGVATPSVTFSTAGAQTLTASDTGNATITGTASTVVTAGAADRLAFTVQPSDAVAGASIAPAIRVEIRDQFGNLVTGSTANVTLAIGANPGGDTLHGTTTVAAVGGVATFNAVNLQKVGAGYTLVVSSGALATATSSTFDIAADAPAALAFSQQPTNAVAGSVIAPAVQVRLVDQFGNLTSSTANITIAIATNPGSGTLSGSLTAAAVAGSASFADLSIDRAGTGYTLRATSGTLPAVASTGFNITPGAPFRVVVGQQPTSTVAGSPITPAVTALIRDQLGNLCTQSNLDVTAILGGGTAGASLLGTTTVTAVAGVATFGDLSVDRTGLGYTLALGSSGLLGTTSVSFNVTTGPAAALAYLAQPPASRVAGAAFTSSVVIQDRFGNRTNSTAAVTVAIGNNPGGGTLSGTATINAFNGLATFSTLSIDKVGTGYTLAASSGTLTGATSGAFNITPAAPASLAFSAQPSSTVAGAVIGPAVQVQVMDAFGNLVTSAASNVTVGIGNNPGGGTLSGTATAAASGGVATFDTLSIDKAGTGYALAASSGTLGSAISSAFDISPAAAVRLAFTVQPTITAAGQAITPAVAVEVRDQFGNRTDSTAAVTVALGNNPGGGTLSGTAAAGAVNGLATFSTLSIDKVGAGYTLAASSGTLASATSNAFHITPAAPASLVFSVQPSSAVAGTAVSPAVQVQVMDAFGNLVTSATSVTVAIGNNPGGGTLSGIATVTASGGVATFGTLSIDKVGTGYTLAASSGRLTSVTSSAFNISPAAAARLAFTVQPTTTVAGQIIAPSVVVEARDQFGNLATSFTGAVQMALQNAGSALLAGTTTVNAVNGSATFSDLSAARSGTGYQLSASSGALTSATSSPFDIGAGPAVGLELQVQPSSAVAGVAISPAIEVRVVDASGNTASGSDPITMAFGNNAGNGTLAGTASVTPTNGVATFSDLSVDRPGTGYTLAAASTGLTGATSAAFNVTSGPPARLAITGLPASATAGTVVAFGLQTLDALGNVASDYAGTVRVTSDDTQATLPANVTLTSGTASAVQITFNTTGTHTVTATDTTTASITGTASTSVSSSGAPTVALSGVTDGQKVSGKVALTATGTQALGTTLTRLEIYVDGTSLASSGTSPLSAEWDTAGLPANSTHVITATATDADGPSATTAPVTVTVGGGGCGCSSAGGADVGALLALGAAVRRLTLRRRRAAK